MLVPAGIVARVLVVPALLEPLISQPPIETDAAVVLYSSTNSSAAPFGPRTRNSLMTTPCTEAAVSAAAPPTTATHAQSAPSSAIRLLIGSPLPSSSAPSPRASSRTPTVISTASDVSGTARIVPIRRGSDYDLASAQSSPTPTSTASGGSS